ncbi:Uncharacterised protein [Vibrio cholerae]|nr:Uncharacterised protein [Vibrio cholerae]CSD17435.1 Uncharacterised protein [Vibrio cholerae]
MKNQANPIPDSRVSLLKAVQSLLINAIVVSTLDMTSLFRL